MPIVSIILPNYNHACYLPRRLESIFNQTYQDFEIILLDDKSPDNSVELLKKYAEHPKVTHFVVNEKNSGSTFKQWNKGVNLAKGKFIWIAESDDYADENLLSRLVEKIKDNDEVGLVYADSKVVDSNNEILYAYYKERKNNFRNIANWQNDYECMGIEDCKNYFIYRNIIPNASAVIFRKELFIKVGGADTSMVVNGDWMLWVKIAIQSRIAYISEPLNYFRTHSNNVRSKAHKDGVGLEERFTLQQYLAERCKLNKKERKELIYNMLDFWAHTLLLHKTSIPFTRKVYLYRILRDIYPNIEIPFFKVYLTLIFKRITGKR